MTEMLLFDSLTHANRSGNWLEHNKFDASLSRLLNEIELVGPFRACLVNIAGYSDNDELFSIASEHRDLFVPIAGLDPSLYHDAAELSNELGVLSERGFAGVKLHPRLNGYDPLDDRCLETIALAGRRGLVVFLDTLFRQATRFVSHTADIVDRIAFSCPETRIVLLHGGASSMLDLYEIVRMRTNLLIDTSFTLMRYAGSSLDADMRFIFRTLDQRATVGSDFPEYSLPAAKARIDSLLEDLPPQKRANVKYRNLDRLFSDWQGLRT